MVKLTLPLFSVLLMQGLLGALGLLPQPLLLDSSASTLAGGAELVQSQLLGCFGFLDLAHSHAFIYGDG